MNAYAVLLAWGLLLVCAWHIDAQDASSAPKGVSEAADTATTSSETDVSSSETSAKSVESSQPGAATETEATDQRKPAGASERSSGAPARDVRTSGKKESGSVRRSRTAPAGPMIDGPGESTSRGLPGDAFVEDRVRRELEKVRLELDKVVTELNGKRIKYLTYTTSADPEMGKFQTADQNFERATQELAERFRTTRNEADREGLLGKLKKIVDEHFNLRQKHREIEVKRLEEQLERLRKSTQQRADNRESIIKQRISSLTGVSDEPGF